jgi:hypothetical protein
VVTFVAKQGYSSESKTTPASDRLEVRWRFDELPVPQRSDWPHTSSISLSGAVPTPILSGPARGVEKVGRGSSSCAGRTRASG